MQRVTLTQATSKRIDLEKKTLRTKSLQGSVDDVATIAININIAKFSNLLCKTLRWSFANT